MPTKKKTPPKTEPVKFKEDGWYNAVTGVGVKGRDKRTYSSIMPHQIPQPILEAMYQTDDIAARVVDRPVEEMFREGFKITIPNDKDDIPEKMMTEWEKFRILEKLKEGERYARLYGGAALVVGLDDGMDPSEPVDFSRINGIKYVTVLDRFRIFPAATINLNVASKNYGYPEHYRVYSVRTTLPDIHHTRVIRFEGVTLPWRLRSYFNYWGDSVYGRLMNVIRDFQSAHASVAIILQDFTKWVIQMKNVASILAMGAEGDKLLQKRLELFELTSSCLNALIIQDGESAEKKSSPVAGLPDLLDHSNQRLVAATDMPHTILLGESPSGLGATGDSEKIDWYDHIRSMQKTRLTPALMQLLKLFFSAKKGVTNGVVPPRYSIEFSPLWQQDENEAAEIRKKQADTDNIYIMNGTLDPQEVRNSRWGSGQYSTETELDENARNALNKALAKADPEGEGDPLEEEEPMNNTDPLAEISGPVRSRPDDLTRRRGLKTKKPPPQTPAPK